MKRRNEKRCFEERAADLDQINVSRGELLNTQNIQFKQLTKGKSVKSFNHSHGKLNFKSPLHVILVI